MRTLKELGKADYIDFIVFLLSTSNAHLSKPHERGSNSLSPKL